MRLSDKEMQNISEGSLLNLVLTEMKMTMPGIDPYKALASGLNCSVQNVRNWVAEKGHPGVTNWFKIAEIAKTNLVTQWILSHIK